jgi:ribonuclease P protein component
VPTSTPPSLWRLTGRAEFARLRHAGRRVRSGPLWLVWAPPVTDGPPRVAFAIGRPVGGAVVRNRLRRRLRAVLTGLTPAPGDYLVGVTPAAAGLSSAELRALAATALDRVGAAAP